MSETQFKKVERVSQVATAPNSHIADNEMTNAALVKPNVSLFHRLPKISQNRICSTDVPYQPLNGSTSDQNGGSSYEDGVRDGQKKASVVYQDTIKLLETSLQTLNNQYQLIWSEIETSHLEAVGTILKAVIPQLAGSSAVDQIRSLIKEICADPNELSIRIHVNPGQVDQINSLVDSRKETGSIIKIVPDHVVEIGNIRCDWEGGGVEIDTKTVIQQSLAILDLALAENKTEEGQENG